MRGTFPNPYPVLILCAAFLILGVGMAFKPEKKAAPAPSASDLARLHLLTQQRRMNELSEFLGNAASLAAWRLLHRPNAPHTAVLWDSRRAISAARPQTDGTPLLVFYEQAPSPLQPPAPGPVVVGQWVIAVARGGGGDLVFAHGLYQGQSQDRCGGFVYQRLNSSAPLSRALLGGGLFTLHGELLGVVVDCAGEPIVVGAESIAELLRRPPTPAQRVRRQYGMAIAQGEHAGGIPVVMVWSGGAADRAGIRAGDVLVEADGVPIASAADLESLLADEDEAEHAITLVRSRRKVRLVLSRAPGGEIAAPGGLRLRLEDSRLLVSSVAPGSPGARSGIQPGDVLLRVADVPVSTPEQAVRRLSRAGRRSTVLTIERNKALAKVLVANE